MSKFYRCSICGNLVELINVGGGQLVCCGKPMELLESNTVDASFEKHVPVIDIKDDEITVSVGSDMHPMIAEHYIEWIYIKVENEKIRFDLIPSDIPKVSCKIPSTGKIEVFAYCNLHGLWSNSIDR